MSARERMREQGAIGGFEKTEICLGARVILCACAALLAACMITAAPGGGAFASEGGGSSFTPGAQGDFAMCYMPPGLYFRNNVIYTEGTLSDYPSWPGMSPAPVSSKLKSKVWFDLLQVVYSSKLEILGGRYFASVNIPFVLDQKLTTSTTIPADPTFPALKDGSHTSGFGDVQLVPFGLLWDMGNFHLLAAQNLVLETGRYEEDKANNTGRNYFSYDEILGLTWLDEQAGREISFMAGLMINTRNDKTEYKTGNEFHVDFTFAQYLSKQFGVGIVGYVYNQVTDDKAPSLDAINAFDEFYGLPGPDGYRSDGAAVGPALILTPNIGGKDVNIIAKWLHESCDNRLEGEWIYLSGCVRF